MLYTTRVIGDTGIIIIRDIILVTITGITGTGMITEDGIIVNALLKFTKWMEHYHKAFVLGNKERNYENVKQN